MKFTYKGEVFEYDELKLSTAEAEMLKRYTGLSPREYFEGIQNMDAAALRGMVWLGLRRCGHGVQYKDIAFDIFEFAEGISRDAAEDDQGDEQSGPPETGPTGTIPWPGDGTTSPDSPST